MNNAGLPGTGLGGFLYLALALSMPFHELYLTIRGRSSRQRWKVVAGQFAIACGILVSVEVTFLALARAGAVPQIATGMFLIAPLLVSLGVLLAVLSALWLWARVVRVQGAPRRIPDGSGISS